MKKLKNLIHCTSSTLKMTGKRIVFLLLLVLSSTYMQGQGKEIDVRVRDLQYVSSSMTLEFLLELRAGKDYYSATNVSSQLQSFGIRFNLSTDATYDLFITPNTNITIDETSGASLLNISMASAGGVAPPVIFPNSFTIACDRTTHATKDLSKTNFITLGKVVIQLTSAPTYACVEMRTAVVVGSGSTWGGYDDPGSPNGFIPIYPQGATSWCYRTITYRASDGTAGSNTAISQSPYYVDYGGNHTVLSGTGLAVPAGKRFAGWTDGTNTYLPGTSINNITGNIILEPVYEDDLSAVDDVITVKPGGTIPIPVLDNDKLLMNPSNPSQLDPAHPLTVNVGSGTLKQPSHGTIILNPNKTITYTPTITTPTWEGIDEFDYEIYYPDISFRDTARVYVLVLNVDSITCSNDRKIQLDMSGTSGATFSWHSHPIANAPIAGSNPILTVSRNDVTHYVEQWLEIDYKPGGIATSLFYPPRIYVRVRFVPKEMYWTAKGNDKDWNNTANWGDRNGTGFTASLQFIPWECTTVHIPGDTDIPGTPINYYPSLTPDSTSRTLVYNGYAGNEPVCDSIYFHFGGEVAQQHYLNYNKALIELTMQANRWYMLSAPLCNMYPGDYYVNNGNPIIDGYVFYTQLFAMSNPQTGILNGSWTGTFSTPKLNTMPAGFPAGFGMGVWLDDDTPADEHAPTSFWFPKHDLSYTYYDTTDGEVFNLTRGREHRFIYEQPGWDKATGKIALKVKATATEVGQQIIVGNPFMSHWNFNDLVADNPGKISNDYKILLPNAGAYTTISAYSEHTKSELSNLIAPMQSILITPLAVFDSLKTYGASTVTKPRVTLRSSSSITGVNPVMLSIVATKGESQNVASLLFNESASNNYVLGEDSYKLFVGSLTAPVVVYTRSADEYALDINVFSNCSQAIPIGIRTSETGSIKLKFNGIENFLPEYDLFLIDMQNGGAKVNLRQTQEYTFVKESSDLFLDGRLYLSFSQTVTGISGSEQPAISIFTKENRLQVISSVNIKEVHVVDMQGRTVLTDKNIESPVYTRDLARNGMYVVKVLTQEGLVSKKITTN